ncbi:hypothetical protein NST63_12940 [Heyndrickxia sp. FSL W8-0496]|uniref:hypothetical protein n=1 Tax=Heyndrickxia TaxID=2837504 RepID=UPI0030FA8E5D
MVNQDFEKFHKLQEQHKTTYLGKKTDQEQLNPDPNYNNQSNTDKAIGSTGRHQ